MMVTMTEKNIPMDEHVDQLIVLIVSDERAGALGKRVAKQGFRFTLVQASGLLQAGTTCMLLGISSARYAELLQLVEKVCKTRSAFIPSQGQFVLPEGLPPMMIEAQVGSALVFSLPIERYEIF